jgi:hypothetical protein
LEKKKEKNMQSPKTKKKCGEKMEKKIQNKQNKKNKKTKINS